MTTRVLKLIVGGACLAALGVVAYRMLFGTFMLYDDEGYVLISLKGFAEHGGLYDRVYSQYGPLFYVAYDLLHRLIGFAWTNTSGRWITWVNWLGAAAGCAVVVVRARAPLAVAIFTLSGVFSFLWIMINEPMHPGGTLALLVALAAWLGSEAQWARRPMRFALIAAGISAAALLIKINVGVCFTLAGGLALAAGIPGRAGRRVFLVLATVAGLFPLLLMVPLLAEPWVLEYAVLVACSIGSAAVILHRYSGWEAEAPVTWRAIGAGIGAALAVLALTALGVMVRGTSLTGLVDGVLLGPLRHPFVYSAPIDWQPGALIVAAAALVLSILAVRRREERRWINLVAAVRLVVAAAFPLVLLFAFAVRQAELILSYGVPLAGLFALPLSAPAARGAGGRSRTWLALLLVFQCLHAYPVAGSQLFWGVFLWYPLMVLGAWEAWEFLLAGRARRLVLGAGALAAVAVLGVAGLMFSVMAENARLRRSGGEPIALPGAERIVMASATATTLQILTTNAVVHGDVLFTLPGMFSFNLWSGVPTAGERDALVLAPHAEGAGGHHRPPRELTQFRLHRAAQHSRHPDEDGVPPAWTADGLPVLVVSTRLCDRGLFILGAQGPHHCAAVHRIAATGRPGPGRPPATRSHRRVADSGDRPGRTLGGGQRPLARASPGWIQQPGRADGSAPRRGGRDAGATGALAAPTPRGRPPRAFLHATPDAAAGRASARRPDRSGRPARRGGAGAPPSRVFTRGSGALKPAQRRRARVRAGGPPAPGSPRRAAASGWFRSG